MEQREFKNRIGTLVQLATIPCVFLLSDVTLNILAGNQISYMWFSPGHRVLSLSAPCLRLVQLLSTGPDLIVLIGGTKVQFGSRWLTHLRSTRSGRISTDILKSNIAPLGKQPGLFENVITDEDSTAIHSKVIIGSIVHRFTWQWQTIYQSGSNL